MAAAPTMGVYSPPPYFASDHAAGQQESSVVYLRDQPTHMVCPHCHKAMQTNTEPRPKRKAYISGGLLAAMGCVWGCCLIPCCMDDCVNVKHTCSNCEDILESTEDKKVN